MGKTKVQFLGRKSQNKQTSLFQNKILNQIFAGSAQYASYDMFPMALNLARAEISRPQNMKWPSRAMPRAVRHDPSGRDPQK